MNTNFLHSNRLNSKSIQQVNDALIVLRHFLELNGKLLPLVFELTYKSDRSKKTEDDIRKIKQVFDSYDYDIESSTVLMDSPILEKIQAAYASIFKRKPELNSKDKLNAFLKELHQLQFNWSRTMAN